MCFFRSTSKESNWSKMNINTLRYAFALTEKKMSIIRKRECLGCGMLQRHNYCVVPDAPWVTSEAALVRVLETEATIRREISNRWRVSGIANIPDKPAAYYPLPDNHRKPGAGNEEGAQNR